MNAEDDVHRIVAYWKDGSSNALWGLGILAVGLVPLAASDPLSWLALLFWLVTALGAVILATGLLALVRPLPPELVLAPQGIFHDTGGGALRIPWSEVEGVDKFEQARTRRGYTTTYRSVMIVLSRDFYDTHIDLLSRWRLPSPDRTRAFHLEYEHYPVRLEEMLDPIRARWRAFGDEASPPAEQEAMFGREVIYAAGQETMKGLARSADVNHGSRAPGPWKKAAIAAGFGALLVLVGNLTGLWETQGQMEARLAREAWEARREEMNRQHRELIERRDRAFEDMSGRRFP